MRLKKARSARAKAPAKTPSPRPTAVARGGVIRALLRTAGELLAIVLEMLRLPAQLFMAAAERAGFVVLAAWRRVVLPALRALLTGAQTLLTILERQLTPARGLALVAAAAAGLLAGAQFADYRGVDIGVTEYIGLETVAPAPRVDTASAGSAHAWVGLPLAALALALIALALRGHPARAQLLAPIGLAAIVIALLIDMPKGLDEGDAATAYEGAAATLLSGFWVQLASGAALVVCGPLLARYLRIWGSGAAVQGPSRPPRQPLVGRVGRATT